MFYYAVLALVLLFGLSLSLWLAFGPGPRRSRAFGRAQRLLESGAWAAALAEVEAQRGASGLSEAWQGRLRNAAGECHQRAADEALKEKRFEGALEHVLAAAELLGQDVAEQRLRVQEAMLAEARRLFAAGTGSAETRATLELLDRTFALCGDGRAGGCPEAWFWRGLCHARQGQTDAALAALTTAFEGSGRQVLDPAFYLGVLLHRQGRPQEALRYLGEANRADASCPFVTWQMGISLVAAGGDSGLAVRALQRALGPRGLSLWVSQPERVWVEAFPEGRSYVRRLANRHPFHCPLLGRDLPNLIRQGQLALALAQYRQERFAEAADLFGKLLQDLPPSVTLLRGYGLSLARLGQYDQAYKHLRAALEQEEPKDPLTAGYLALCGALGKPTQPEDKPKNVLWAVRLLGRYPLPGNAEWARLISTVHAEAREAGLALGVEDQLLLCETLASVQATDQAAAAAFAHLAATFPEAVQEPYPWLYARACSALGVSTPQDLDLFARAFRDAGAARDYFSRQGWDLEEVEYTYLQRSAAQAPGHFPEALGGEYPQRGEAFLLERSRREEAAGRPESARAAAEVLLRLSPGSVAAHDRLACLCYRGGEVEQAVTLLGDWHRLAPADHWPLVRQAIIEQERGNAERRAEAIGRALGLTRGPLRSAVAFLGARLALREGAKLWGKGRAPADEAKAALGHSQHLLQACLRDDPDHTEALWCLAAVRSVLGDVEGLAAQAPLMDRPEVTDARFHYLGAVCHLAARDYGRVLELGGRAAEDQSLAVESQFVMAWAHLHQENAAAARQSLQQVAAAEASPSAPYARALLGHLSFARGAADEAVKWWGAVEPRARAAWHLDEPLRQTVLLAGLEAFEARRYEQAAERFREAGKLGLRDRRLGGLITLALVKAAQRLLFGSGR
jgi:tetratricopeptide (TPR) repeat protein